MVRLTAIFPILLSIAAFIMSLLVLLSGKNVNFYPNIYLLRVSLLLAYLSLSLSLSPLLLSPLPMMTTDPPHLYRITRLIQATYDPRMSILAH